MGGRRVASWEGSFGHRNGVRLERVLSKVGLHYPISIRASDSPYFIAVDRYFPEAIDHWTG